MATDSVAEVVDKMIAFLEEHRTLPQPQAAKIARSVDEGLTYRSEMSGAFLLSSEVLDAFRERTEGDVVWARGGRYWRYRNEADPEDSRATY